jgi:hypothetical protein
MLLLKTLPAIVWRMVAECLHRQLQTYSILCSETNLCKSANTIITNNMHIGPEFPPRHHQNFAKPVAVSSKHPGNMPLFVKVLWIQILGIYWHILEPDPKHSYSNPSLLSSP